MHFCLSEGSVTAFIDTTFNQIFCIETKTVLRKHLIIALRKAGEAFFKSQMMVFKIAGLHFLQRSGSERNESFLFFAHARIMQIGGI